MGDYATIDVRLPLHADTPANIIEYLQYETAPGGLADGDTWENWHASREAKPTELGLTDPFFKHDRWRCVFVGASGDRHREATLETRPEGGWLLSVCGGIKYGSAVAEAFVRWLEPYIAAEVGTVLGEWMDDTWDDGWETITYQGDGVVNMPRGTHDPYR